MQSHCVDKPLQSSLERPSVLCRKTSDIGFLKSVCGELHWPRQEWNVMSQFVDCQIHGRIYLLLQLLQFLYSLLPTILQKLPAPVYMTVHIVHFSPVPFFRKNLYLFWGTPGPSSDCAHGELIIFRSTRLSRPNEMSVHPSVRQSVHKQFL